MAHAPLITAERAIYSHCCHWNALKSLRTALSIGIQWVVSFPFFVLGWKRLTH